VDLHNLKLCKQSRSYDDAISNIIKKYMQCKKQRMKGFIRREIRRLTANHGGIVDGALRVAVGAYI
jgi:hypothetical protein